MTSVFNLFKAWAKSLAPACLVPAHCLAGLLSLLMLGFAQAQIPAELEPLLVTPVANGSERVLNLSPALDKSKQLNKPLLLYLGASDCPYCKSYSAFLGRNTAAMKIALADVVLVDIRSSLRGPRPSFQIYDKVFTAAEFKSRIGDPTSGLRYPTWWLLDSNAQQIRPWPSGWDPDEADPKALQAHIRLIKG